MWHLFYTTSSFVHHFKSIGELKLKLQSRNAQFGSKLAIFFLCHLEIWWMTWENNRASLLNYIKLWASFQMHRWIQIGVTVRKRSIWVKIGNFLSRVTLKFDRWPWKSTGHLSFKLYASFHSHHWIQTGVAFRKRPILVKINDFLAVWPWNLTGDLAKQKGTSSMLLQALCSISYPLVNWNLSYSPETLNLGQNKRFF